MNAPGVAEESEDPRFVKDAPMLNAIAESLADDLGVIGEAANDVAIGPAAGVFESLRKVPVIKSADGTDFCFEQLIGNAFVIVETFFDRGAGALGLNARPSDGEATALEIELLHDGDVFFVAVVGIAGDVAGVAAFHFADSMRETVPDGFALAV